MVRRLCDKRLMALLLTWFLASGIVLLAGCRNATLPAPLTKQPTGTLKGVTLSPLSFGPNDFSGFFDRAKQAGGVISWAGDWNEVNNTSDGGPKVVCELAPAYGYIPLIELQFFTQSTGSLLRPMDDATRQAYKGGAVALAEKYKLDYLAVGIEVNTLYAKSPRDFDAFVQFFDEVYDAVKAKSPETKVFTIFQLEMMKGLNGGLFGGVDDESEAQWSLLERLAKTDIVAFTTYPGLVYLAPSDIPPDYYSDIKMHTSKPVAFTEIGWHSQAAPSGWESSDSEQAEFVDRFFSLTLNLKEDLAIWSFMYDQDTVVPFSSMGLFRRDGNAKPAWDAWLSNR